MTVETVLPPAVCALLDGTALEERVGVTLLLIVADGDLPRVAAVSVGEVLAVTPGTLMMTLYETSRTARALESRGSGMLFLVEAGGVVKISLSAEVAEADAGRTVFRCAVERVERDSVAYARVVHGIEFELVADREQVLDRWRAQLERLKELSA